MFTSTDAPSAASLSNTTLGNYLEAVNERYVKHKTETFLRSIAWYILLPLALFYVFAPGLIFSIPAEPSCSDNVPRPIAPERVTFWNTAFAVFVFYLIILLIIFGLGGYWGIAAPFQPNVISKFALGTS